MGNYIFSVYSIVCTIIKSLVLVVVITFPIQAKGSPPLLSTEIIGHRQVYTVKPGDTLSKISKRNNVPTNKILKMGPNSNRNHLVVGQKLVISERKILPKAIEDGIIINLPEYSLYQFQNGVLKNVYPIAIGKRSWHTPTGIFHISQKARNPSWQVPPGMIRRLKMARKVVPPGPRNPLGEVWIGLDLPHIGIHSTNKPSTVGKARSHGCMRMYPKDAKSLFNTIEVGDQGEIIYEPLKFAIEGGVVYIEVHRDVYGKIPNMYEEALRRLGDWGLGHRVDLDKVAQAIRNANGAPVAISGENISITGYLKQVEPATHIDNDSTMLWKGNAF